MKLLSNLKVNTQFFEMAIECERDFFCSFLAMQNDRRGEQMGMCVLAFECKQSTDTIISVNKMLLQSFIRVFHERIFYILKLYIYICLTTSIFCSKFYIEQLVQLMVVVALLFYFFLLWFKLLI